MKFKKNGRMNFLVRNKPSDDDEYSQSLQVLNWSGVNSGVSVLKPNNDTFTELVNELSILPNRVCCPSQEFLYYFFEQRNMYFRLPPVYNGRMSTHLTDHEWASYLMEMKIYHFLGTKPWKKRAGAQMNRLWWKYRDELNQEMSNF
jgi:lipopolysaccharide biosynthesis glycosyltransferase